MFQVFACVKGLRQRGAIHVFRQRFQVGLVVQKSCLPFAQAMAFFPSDISGIMAVGAVPGQLQVVRGKTVFNQQLLPPAGDPGSCLPEGLCFSGGGRVR